MRRARLLACVFLVCVCAAVGTVQAQVPTALEAAEHAFEDLEFEQAAKLYRRALSAPGSRDERTRAYRGLGLCLAYLGDAAGAQRMFETLLVLDPTAKVNTALGPKISRPFEAALRAVKKAPAELAVTRDERTGEVSAILTGLLPAADIVELHSMPGEDASLRAQAHAPGPARLEVEPWKEVRVFARVLDAGGGELLGDGSADVPSRFAATARAPVALVPEVEEAPARAWPEDPEPTDSTRRTRWPLWVAGAAVVIGGGVAAALALRPPEPLSLPPADRSGRLP